MRNSFRCKFFITNGFALVATLSLMILLTLIAVGLLSLSAVSLRGSSQSMAQSEAQANARLALMLAIGELQKAMGPDQRISARAQTLAKHPKLTADIQPNTGKAWWVGVSHSDPAQTIGGQPVVWLVSGVNSASQISQSLADPEPLYTEKSIDTTALTGGQPIEAGKVGIQNQQGKRAGRFAYLVDDDGMKAQLAATNPKVRNDLAMPYGGGVLAGTYNLGILDKMEALDQKPLENYNRLLSLNDLPLIGANRDITRTKKLGYTTRSLGVLADVKRGGLKKDLTVAFETYNIQSGGSGYPNKPVYTIFDKVFAKKSNNNWDKYLLVDESKRSEFGVNGYIHWAMLRDYYNLKRYIRRESGKDCLDPITVSKAGVNASYGTIPPHEMGPGSGRMPGEHIDMPYGNYMQIPNLQTPFDSDKEYLEYYKHSPIMPVIAEMQINAWLENSTAPDPNNSSVQKPTLQTNTQIWVSHYNPYNISMRCVADSKNASLRMIGFPQAYCSVPNSINLTHPSNYNLYPHPSPYQSMRCLGKLEYHVPGKVILEPGRGQMCAFEKDAQTGQEQDGFAYGKSVRNLTLENAYNNFFLTGSSPGNINWFVDIHDGGVISHGIDNWAGRNFEISQILFAPIAVKAVKAGNYRDTPGARIEMSSATYNSNSMAKFRMQLRSTMEDGASVRPLIDSNIRGFYFNPRWDSPLGLDMTAAYTWTDSNRDPLMDQIPYMSTQSNGEGCSYWGGAHDPFDGYDRVILFDIPRTDLVSLGQLQHANVGRFSYEPSYIVGNSYANPRIPLNAWKASISDTFSTAARGFQANGQISGPFKIYDASYLVNEVLWDSYILTTIPQMTDDFGAGSAVRANAATYTSLLNGTTLLPNPRFIPYEPAGSRFDITTLQDAGNSTGSTGSFHHNAGHLLVDGAFNVNSTSVDAWEAFLSGTYGMPYQKIDVNGQVTGFKMPTDKKVRFPRVQSVFGEAMESDNPDENYWVGFRALEQDDVRELATEIVNQITERGPFLTLGDFVNRKLGNDALGEKGALQAALDKTINKKPLSGYDMRATHTKMPSDSNQAAGFPGQLLQGDLLQALSPCMTVRSDTFTIRAYGESLAPGTNDVRARAWCEATVQRYPDPVPNTGASSGSLAELVNPGSSFGRGFRLISFRWLNANEV